MSAAAFFDVDGTLVKSNIVHYYIFLRTRNMSPFLKPFWYAGYACRCGQFWVMDQYDRVGMNAIFYRGYRHFAPEDVYALAQTCYETIMKPQMFAEVAATIQREKAAGRRIVLVTGSLDFLMQPLAADLGVDDLVCSSLEVKAGKFTGDLNGAPVGGEEKARRMREFAKREQLDLNESSAYGDSYADLPMLECVGQAHAVNPDKKLVALALVRGWDVHTWKVAP